MRRVERQRRVAGLVAAAGLAASLALTGCGASPQGASTSAADAQGDTVTGAGRQDAGAGQEDAAQPEAASGTPADLRVDQQAIIYSGSITVRVENVNQAATRTASLATSAGGFVGAEQRNNDDNTAGATLRLRVPAKQFTKVIDEIAGLGRSPQREVSAENVTEETVDLDARIASQRARVDSGRRLLAQAKSLADLVMLEGELAKREADLASLEARKRQLVDLTALSTITVTLIGPESRKHNDKPRSGFLPGLSAGWSAFVASARVLLTVLGALLPWILAFGVPLLGARWLLGRFRRSRPAPSGRPVAPPAAATAPPDSPAAPTAAATAAPAPRTAPPTS